MFSKAFFLFLCCAAFDGFMAQRRVINGIESSIEKHPYLVGILVLFENSWTYNCGGSIINEYTILTAAHCVIGLDPNHCLIKAGSTNYSEGQNYTVSDIIIDPKYDPERYRNDAAIVKLSRPLLYNDKIMPIALQPALEEVQEETKAIAAGRGATSIHNFQLASNKLYEIEVLIQSQNKCKSILRQNLEDEMCAVAINSTLCKGDSGGPLVANGKLIGINSWGIQGCPIGYPTVFAKVSALRDFIDKHL